MEKLDLVNIPDEQLEYLARGANSARRMQIELGVDHLPIEEITNLAMTAMVYEPDPIPFELRQAWITGHRLVLEETKVAEVVR